MNKPIKQKYKTLLKNYLNKTEKVKIKKIKNRIPKLFIQRNTGKIAGKIQKRRV